MSDHRAPVPSWDPRAYLKAAAAFIAPALAILAIPLVQGEPPTEPDYWKALGAAVTAFVAVYLAPKNRPSE